jgi:predicted ABC-class ATPase
MRETAGMTSIDDLYSALEALDGKGYKAYKTVEGAYEAPRLTFHLDHAQGDPFAEPSRVRAEVASRQAQFPAWALGSEPRRRAAADFLNRRLLEATARRARNRGSGKSGEILVLEPTQEVLARSSVELGEHGAVLVRFRVGLPARGRRILGRAAAELIANAVAALEESVFFGALDASRLRRHLETVEDAVALRRQLQEAGLVAFVADGARLPRRSGIDDRPLETGGVVPFQAPESLRVVLRAPNAGEVAGLGVPVGVTLIVGGGYHGKSTLLRAIERGVYDHVPGDGRERVVTLPHAVKVRAEDGRRVAGTDISNFIGSLPSGDDTARFNTDNASGSTSQAAAIVEALEAGASALLLDEDTSATNFMIRDARMQRLIASQDEPITPFIDRARVLARGAGVSTVVVVGGSGDYFDVADTVIAMRRYRPCDVTAEAREVARTLPTARRPEAETWRPVLHRRPEPDSIDPSAGRRDVAIRILSRDRVQFGRQQVDLGAVEQIVETAQTRAMAYAVERARHGAMDGDRSLAQVVAAVLDEIRERGLGVVHPHDIGELAAFRGVELAALLNRLRTLRTVPAHESANGTGPRP